MNKSTRQLVIATVIIMVLLVSLPFLGRQRPTAPVVPSVQESFVPTAAQSVVPPALQLPQTTPPPVLEEAAPPPVTPPTPKARPSVREKADPPSRVQRNTPPVPPPAQAAPQNSTGVIENAFRNHTGNLPVVEMGTVSRMLSDDNSGSRHQRFIVSLASGHTVLIAHNIDIAPRINSLREGDQITFSGLFEWNEKGGVVHWTHHDPSGRYSGGYLQHNGMVYK